MRFFKADIQHNSFIVGCILGNVMTLRAKHILILIFAMIPIAGAAVVYAAQEAGHHPAVSDGDESERKAKERQKKGGKGAATADGSIASSRGKLRATPIPRKSCRRFRREILASDFMTARIKKQRSRDRKILHHSKPILRFGLQQILFALLRLCVKQADFTQRRQGCKLQKIVVVR